MEAAQPSARRHAIIGAKLAVTAALIWFVASQLDWQSFVAHWRRLNPGIVLLFLAIVALQITLIAGMRLKLLLQCVAVEQPLVRTSQIELCGFFFEQVALGFVGGDAMRLWLLSRIGISLRNAFKALLVDRFLGFSALLFLVALGLPGLVELIPNLQERVSKAFLWAMIGLAVATALFAALLLPERYWKHPVLRELRELASMSVRDSRVRFRFLLAFAFATLTHLLNILIIFLIASNLGLPISLDQWFFIVPAALLFSMIPVSIGGWGLREGIFVLALGALGIAPEEATVVSVLFGLGVLATTLPGGFVWLSNRR